MSSTSVVPANATTNTTARRKSAARLGVHTLVSLSVIVTHLISHDPFGAVRVTVIALLCLVAVTLVGAGVMREA